MPAVGCKRAVKAGEVDSWLGHQCCQQVFPHVAQLRRNEAWNPWKWRDPTMALTYGGPAGGVGAYYEWRGEHSGTGRLTIVESEPTRRIATALDFGGHGKASGTWTFEPHDGGTRATWAFDGDAGWSLSHRYFGLFVDAFLGPQMRDGLERLKKVVEAERLASH